jgi:hypothetical protein
LGLKVSDEFTVPLCAIHHSENHATGNEKGWWEQHKIDPLVIAETLWHRGRLSSAPSVAPGDGQPEEAKNEAAKQE